MVKLCSKFHLSRQGRKSSSLSQTHLADPPAQTRPAGSTTTAEPGPAERPSPSPSSPGAGLAVTALPEELLVAVASTSCDTGDITHPRWALRRMLDKSSTEEDILLELMSPLPPTNGMPSRDALIQMIKAQLDADSRDQDFKRDVFLSLAVTVPPRSRARIRDALGPLLARARRRGSGRDSVLSVHDNSTGGDKQRKYSADNNGEDDEDDVDISVELQNTIGVISTLLVLGYSDVCDLDMGRRLMPINHWSVKSSIWAERRLLKHKDLSLQLAFSMALGLLHPTSWKSSSSSSSSSPPACAAPDDYQSLARRVRADYHGAELATPSSQSFWLSWEGLHARSLQLAGLLAFVLRTCGFEDVPRSDLVPLLRGPTTSTSTPQQQLRLPLLENFNPGSTADPAVRAHPGAWQEWYASRVRDLVSSVEDEEWYGYYVYTLESTDNRNPAGSSDPAMENVHFRLGGGDSTLAKTITTTTTTTTAAYKVLPLEARGCRDGITREFDLVGTVHAGTGVVGLRKSYWGAHCWDYDGVVTPLGIVGEWGREGTGYDGYFWLWKRSWMVGDAVQRNHAYI